MGAILDAVLNPPTEEPTQAPPVENGKMTAAIVFNTLVMMGKAIERIHEAFGKIPEASPAGLDSNLDDIIQQAKSLITKAERLKRANV